MIPANAPSIKNPFISVLLPVFNGGSYLEESVQSVLSQDMDNFELLVVDDCSADGSYDYLRELTDTRITLFKNETNKGLFYNLNFLIKKCNSSLIKLWAQDDRMYPGCLAAFVDFHKQYPNIGFSYCGRDIMDEKGIIKENNLVDHTPELISPQLHARIAYFTGSIAGNIANVCINRNALKTVGLFKERMKISADFDLWVRLAKDHDTGFIREKLIRLRDHSGQLSLNEKYYLNHVKEDLEVYRYLDSYAEPSLRKEGKGIMRRHKLVFYYTLMAKAFLKGKLKTAAAFFKELSGYDNFFMITVQFFKSKLKKTTKPDLLR